MRMVRLYADDHGETHFDEVELDLAPASFAPPAPALEVSEVFLATGVVVVRIPADWPAEWHPSPQRQIWIGLSGEITVTVSDGETRTIPAGVPWLMEGERGRGHATVALGGEPAVEAVIQLA